ncbi:MAG: fimbrillin family protein, partial [Phocaeicola sp.]
FKEFQVYGYRGEIGADASIAWDSEKPTLLMDNVKVTKTGDAWETVSPTPWPTAGTHVQFFAFSPAASAESGIGYAKDKITHEPALSFTAQTKVDKQVDLLYAQSKEMEAAATGAHSKVNLTFTHALTKVKFSAKVQPNQELYLSGLSLHNLGKEGSFAYTTGESVEGKWNTEVAANDSFAIALSGDPINPITSTEAVDVTAKDGATLVIPQKREKVNVSAPAPGLFTGNTENSYIKMVYSLKNTTIGDWIVGKGSEVENQVVAYIPVDVAFDMNQVVNYVINFGTGNGGYDDGGNPIIDSKNMIQFDTKLTDWDAETPIDPTPTPTPPVEGGIHFESSDETLGTVDNPGGTGVIGDPFESTAAAKENCTFEGWFVEGQPVVAGDDITITGNTLMVKLTEETGGKTYTAKFEQAAPEFSFTIKTTAANTKYSLPFGISGATGDYELTVNWGDGTEIQTIAASTPLTSKIEHTYAVAGEFTITITSSETDYTKAQMPMVSWKEDTRLISIDTPLLNTAVTDFSDAFYDCSSLTSIPEGLFKYNTAVTNFKDVFRRCTSLTTIPEGLFANNTKVTSFYGVFQGCTKAKANVNIFCDEATEKNTRFSSVTSKIDFTWAFYNVGSTLSDVSESVFPALWEYDYHEDPSKRQCFRNAKASNSDAVATEWKE